MALTEISPIPVRVRWTRTWRQPASLHIGDRQLRVIGLRHVRDELAAYPQGRGPRVTFLLDTDAGPARLVYDARRRRYYVEALERAA